MPTGTVSVRVVRKVPANAVANTEVTALVRNAGGDMRKRTAKTDDGGRAMFEGMVPGDEFKAEVTVDGEKLATETFTMPPAGGIRTMLISGLKGGAGAGAGGGAEGGGGENFTLGATAGTAAPDPSLPAQTLEVRLFDEGGAAVTNHQVTLGMVDAGGKITVKQGKSDGSGVARFSGLPAGKTTGYAAIVEWHGMRLGTEPFAMPESGGVRAEIRAFGRTTDPAVVTIGPGARIVVQLREDNLQFLEMLPLENRSDKLFDPGPGAIEIPLPQGFTGAQSQDSDRKVEVRQNHGVAVHGAIVPHKAVLAPGSSEQARRTGQEVAFGFVLPYSGPERDFAQPVPNGIGPFTLITEQIPGLTVSGPGIGNREGRELGGHKYWVMPGEAIPPGGVLKFTLIGLPATDSTGRTVAGALALALMAAAFAFGRTPKSGKRSKGSMKAGGPNAVEERTRLVKTREALFSDLVALETTARASGAAAPGDRRKQLVTRLEQVYRELASLDDARPA